MIATVSGPVVEGLWRDAGTERDPHGHVLYFHYYGMVQACNALFLTSAAMETEIAKIDGEPVGITTLSIRRQSAKSAHMRLSPRVTAADVVAFIRGDDL